VKNVYVEQGERDGGEGGLDKVGVLAGARGVADDLAVVQVDEQADVAPCAEHAHVGEVAYDVGVRGVPVELAVQDVGQPGLVGLFRMGLELGLGVAARQVARLHDGAYPPAARDDLALGQRPLYPPGPVAPAAPAELLLDGVGDRVPGLFGLGLAAQPVVGRPGHA